MDKLQPVKLAKVSVKINIDNDLMVIRTVYILILPFYPFPHYFYSKLLQHDWVPQPYLDLNVN
jgi:hypothetical protein